MYRLIGARLKKQYSLTDAFTWLDENALAMRSQLTRWSNINSGTREADGLERMRCELITDWREQGMDLRDVSLDPICEIDETGQEYRWQTVDALRAAVRQESKRRVLLAIHFDTVFAASNPFQVATLDDEGILNGPGAVDAKGGLLVMMWALAAIERFQLAPAIGWTAFLNPDEEIGSPASAQAFRELAKTHDFGLLFEPCMPDGCLISNRKGSGSFVVVVRGRSAHSGRDPEKGRSAITLLAEVILKLDSLNDYESGLIVNVGKIEGGGALNRVPDLAIARMNVRVSDEDQAEEFQVKLQMIAKTFSEREGYHCEQYGGFHAPPKKLVERAERLQIAIEQAASESGQTVSWRPTGGACDGNKLQHFGLPNIDTLGPKGGDLHSPTEWVDTKTLADKSKVIVALLMRYSEGKFEI